MPLGLCPPPAQRPGCRGGRGRQGFTTWQLQQGTDLGCFRKELERPGPCRMDGGLGARGGQRAVSRGKNSAAEEGLRAWRLEGPRGQTGPRSLDNWEGHVLRFVLQVSSQSWAWFPSFLVLVRLCMAWEDPDQVESSPRQAVIKGAPLPLALLKSSSMKAGLSGESGSGHSVGAGWA